MKNSRNILILTTEFLIIHRVCDKTYQTMKLEHKIIKEIKPTAPFNFNATFHKPAHFPSEDNCWKTGIRWQTFRYLGKCLGVIFRNTGSVDKPKIKVEIFSDEQLPENLIEKFIKEITIYHTPGV